MKKDNLKVNGDFNTDDVIINVISLNKKKEKVKKVKVEKKEVKKMNKSEILENIAAAILLTLIPLTFIGGPIGCIYAMVDSNRPENVERRLNKLRAEIEAQDKHDKRVEKMKIEREVRIRMETERRIRLEFKKRNNK